MHAFIGDGPEIEYLGGRAVAKVSPKHRHGVVQGTLWSLLARLGAGRGTTATEWRFRISDEPGSRTWLVPDVAFMSFDRWKRLSEQERQEPRCAPDIAIEIRSEGDRAGDVLWKMHAYLNAGALLALDVLPEERTIVSYTRSGIREFALSSTFETESVPWLQFAVAEAFEHLDPCE
jgi:Uma2 family endonuclease